MDTPTPNLTEEPLANDTIPEMAVLIAMLEKEIIKAGGGEERISHAFAAEQEEGCEGSINEGKILKTLGKDYRLHAMRAIKTYFKLNDDEHQNLIDELTEHAEAFAQSMVKKAIDKPTKGIGISAFGIGKTLDAIFASVDVCTPDQGRRSDS